MKLRRAKEALTIPVIGSLNCVYEDTWEEYAKKMAEAGVDGLELNFYDNNIDPEKTGTSIIGDQINILKIVKEAVDIPVAVKLSPYYTNTLGVIHRMDDAGANAFVLLRFCFWRGSGGGLFQNGTGTKTSCSSSTRCTRSVLF